MKKFRLNKYKRKREGKRRDLSSFYDYHGRLCSYKHNVYINRAGLIKHCKKHSKFYKNYANRIIRRMSVYNEDVSNYSIYKKLYDYCWI